MKRPYTKFMVGNTRYSLDVSLIEGADSFKRMFPTPEEEDAMLEKRAEEEKERRRVMEMDMLESQKEKKDK